MFGNRAANHSGVRESLRVIPATRYTPALNPIGRHFNLPDAPGDLSFD